MYGLWAFVRRRPAAAPLRRVNSRRRMGSLRDLIPRGKRRACVEHRDDITAQSRGMDPQLDSDRLGQPAVGCEIAGIPAD
jgi:hypothetical protein